MGRKKKSGFYLFGDDILSSDDCCNLSDKAVAVYFFLLCRLAKQEMPGCYRLGRHEYKKKRGVTLTDKCLAEPDKQARLKYFAKYMAKKHLPRERGDVEEAFNELYERGMIIVERDMLIQPRMWLDQRVPLDDLDIVYARERDEMAARREADTAPGGAEILSATNEEEKGAKKGTQKRTKKGTQNSRPPAGDARAQSKRGRGRVKDNNSIGNKGVQGDKTPVKPKTQEKSPDGENVAFEGEKKLEAVNCTSGVQKPASVPEKGSDGQKIPVADQPPTLREIQDYMQQRGEGGDPFRHITAEQFYDEGCMSGWTIRGGQPLYSWQARLRSLEGYRRKNGEPAVTEEGYVAYRDGKLVGTLAVRSPSAQMTGAIASHVSPPPKPGDPVAATKPTGKKYKDKW